MSAMHSSFAGKFKKVSSVAAALAFSGALCASVAHAAPTSADSAAGYSSSAAYASNLNTNELVGNTLATNPTASGQYGSQAATEYPNTYQSRWNKVALEFGGGFAAPIGNDTHGYNTWGYNLRVGGGWNFNKRLGALVEFSFIRTKVPGITLSYLSQSYKISPLYGNINNWSFTIDPIFYQPITHSVGVYVTGGGGFYRKVTNFSTPVPFIGCDYYYGCYASSVPVTVAHSSSNQGGMDAGFGVYWKAFGEQSNAKLYMEARYVWIDSPNSSQSDPYGSGTEGLIPVTFGVRF